MAKRKLTLADLDSLNMPSSSNSRGIADPAALQALAWGEDYDVDARRDAIAAALLAQTVAAPTAAAAPGFDQLTTSLGDARLSGSGDYGMAGGQQAGDASSVSVGGLFGASTPGYSEGAPGAGFGIGRGAAVDGAMTTSNASLNTLGDPNAGYTTVADPGWGGWSGAPDYSGKGGTEDTGKEQGPSSPAPSTPGGRSDFASFDPGAMTTSNAAMTGGPIGGGAAVGVPGGFTGPGVPAGGYDTVPGGGVVDPSAPTGPLGQASPSTFGFSSTGGWSSPMGTPSSFANAPAVTMTQTDTPITPTGTPNQTFSDRWGPTGGTPVTPSVNSPDYNSDFDVGGIVDSIMGNVTLGDQALADMTGAGVPGNSAPGGRGPGAYGGGSTYGGATPGGGAVADNSGIIGSIMGNVTAGNAALGAMTGSGGYGPDFAGTGGYSGSADIGNTASAAAASAAAGFAGTGDFSGGAGIGGGGGADPGGGGAVGGGGGGSDPGGSSPGGVG